MMSQSSGSDANSISRRWGPICNCGKATTVTKAWTNENPGRRFFRCGVHGFINWADEEKPFGWQKVSLLEARDEIRQLKESLKAMKEHMVSVSGSGNYDNLKVEEELKKMEEEKKKLEEEKKKLEEEKKKLEIEVMGCNEREKMLRQLIVLSWGCFIVVVAMCLGMGNK
ncbi:hypothetical protein ISN45_Aa03g006730 [Arabidopsis thaliana x Arabidopsis arenosa]|uniref:GRF-type domain-containing protein n=1 Tax=Arabidopsis thaliana x Arabidopsis arenosa TaxID=1240361 RepID=A0A8T2AQG3_9BRAS|nr:hypothetical protein ISN45_Aa03g006730 [Arabidopsis thaliana x Arabidopsis arenosa]